MAIEDVARGVPPGARAGTGGAATVEAFTRAFRGHPAGLALITAATDDGPVGLTASSVASVAIDPLALSFSVTRSTGSAGAVLCAETFVVHLVDDRHVDLVRVFATPGSERFTPGQGWALLPTGEPHLPAARVAMRCRALQTTPVGSSTLVLAEVLAIHAGPSGRPVVHHDRRYRALGDERPS